jgi:uncharacterized protein (DUF169 family)
MSRYQEIAAEITTLLGLATPPVAVAFVDEPPSDIPSAVESAPSTCAFWRRAEKGVSYVDAAQHFNCQIGAMVMGFPLPEQIMQEIGGLVETMSGHSYLAAEEGAKIPSVGRSSAGAIYGPLSEMPVAPDAVVLWLSPRQAMLFNEASGSASWAMPSSRVGSRPACAAIPLALQEQRPTLSLGCIGMRTFTEVADDRMLAVIPGDKLDAFPDQLRVLAEANSMMLSYYEQRAEEVMGSPSA